MAGAGKQRDRKERKNGNGNGNGNGSSENGKSSNSPTSPTAGKSSSSESPPNSGSPPAGYDGNRDPAQPAQNPIEEQRVHRNMDLGLANSYFLKGLAVPSDIPQRPKVLNKTGKPISVKLNTFHVQGLPPKPVFQYDVAVGNGQEKRGLIKAVWQSKAVAGKLGPGWIFDGNKIAYSLKDITEERINVNLDKEGNKPPRKDKKTGAPKVDEHMVRVKKAKQVSINVLQSFLEGASIGWDNNCNEAMTFLDHLLRETPSRTLTSIKRNFFHHGQQRTMLGGGVEAMKGVYASMRPVLGDPSGKATISVNVDVANTTFWSASPLPIAAQAVTGARDIPSLIQALRPSGKNATSPAFQMLRRLHRVGVECTHRDPKNPDRYFIEKFLPIRPKDKTFTARHADGKEEKTNVEAYMQKKYGKRLQYPDLPLVKMTKGDDTVVPMELCQITENQRYAFKLSDRQTMEMIKFAVTLPEQRWRDIQNGISMLNWGSDQYLQKYGMRINSQAATVPSVLLPPPKVHFSGGGDASPNYSGRWDLRGKRFLNPHPTPLQSWGIAVIPGRFAVDQAQVQAFVANFIRTFEGHGGKIANKSPVIQQGNRDAGQSVEQLWNATGNQSKASPQLLVFIVPDKSSEFYQRIKKSTDCRYGVVSQVLQSAHVQKNQGQYCSNVAMKVNAKLGGATAQAFGLKRDAGWWTKPTLIIGADVSHGAPGSGASSIAAITVSWDRQGIRYAAAVETNGQRTEMITKANWESMLKPLVQQWIKAVGGGKFPQQVFYFRDGVSEGQYSQVREKEITAIKEVMNSIEPKNETKYTALTCTKRHHVRFFPDKKDADRNGNPQPGTLVSHGVTAPNEFDFYLCAHSAIKGTARPVHYYVLLDEAKLGMEELQNMIYEASYQYVRSTTPVSLFPAIYYAHLAAARGTSHMNAPSESGERSKTGASKDSNAEVSPLLPMPNQYGIKGVMWYV